jgi:hypothetical protein
VSNLELTIREPIVSVKEDQVATSRERNALVKGVTYPAIRLADPVVCGAKLIAKNGLAVVCGTAVYDDVLDRRACL